jgi:ATP-dependent DNA helicase RecG
MEITQLKGIGDKTARLFDKLNIRTVEELLHFYPRDYQTFEEPRAITEYAPGELATISGTIESNILTRRAGSKSVTVFTIGCEGGAVSVTYFNMPYLSKSLRKGQRAVFVGILRQKGSRYAIDQPKMYRPEEYAGLLNTLQPIYPTTKGLSSHAISKAVKQALTLDCQSIEYLPEEIRERYQFPDYRFCIEQMHFPSDKETLLKARERLVFDEFFLFILLIRSFREKGQEISNGFPMLEVAESERLIEALPYRLTGAQQKVWKEIKADLTSEHTMNRLIQGDVGSGKTILAFLSLLMCVANGYQGALMAPTEVLAHQHYENLCQLREQYHLPIHPVLLTGSVTAAARRDIYGRIESGEADIVIGTHALIQDKVSYHRLALVITDEQHRFGVRQRAAFAEKGRQVHVLVMSATPIPRTLAIILYGDLHISVLDELPADRLPIKNCVVNTSYREKAYRFMEKEILAGRQVYVICPMVEENEAVDLEDVLTYTEKLKAVMPKEIRISYLHGRMKPADKNRIMEEFASHQIDILVSTTVIEVGVNVPNATVMMVENAERFGLAQLHQLRGRVGRGKEQSYCIFISQSDRPEIMKRLQILNESNDGFYIAGQDLKLRGPGDMFGIRQSGDLHFQLGDIYQDAALLQKASEEADRLFAEDSSLQKPENRALLEFLDQAAANEVDFRII